jgi:uncharacterized protein YukE
MTSFYVNHGEQADAHNILQSAVSNLGSILMDLNHSLRSMNEAVQGQAAPLWEDQQKKWDGDYHMMCDRLHSGATAVLDIHETFLEGDRNGARVIL